MKLQLKESNQLEFKEKLPSHKQVLKTVVGFANLHGGRIMVGVRDDGEVMGLDKDPQDLIELLSQLIYDSCSPTLMPRFYVENYGTKSVLVLEVSAGSNKPYRLKAVDQGIYIRVGNTTLKATQDIIEELQLQTLGKSYDEMPCYAAKETHLNKQEILEILKQKRIPNAKSIPQNLFKSMKLLHEDHGKLYPTNGAVLLFCKDMQDVFSESNTICSVFSGSKGRDILETRDFNGSLFTQLESCYEFILQHISQKISIKSLKQNVEYRIPPVAIREALINAYVHRNYHIPSPIKIAVYEDRLEIFSPGEFIGPLDPEKIELGVSYIRNKVLARWFRENGLMEKLGSGLTTIFDEYEEAGLMKPTINEVSRNVKIILPMTKTIGSSDEEAIVQYIRKNGPLGITEIHESLPHLSRATVGRKLKLLVNEGSILTRGNARGVKYYI